MTREILVLTLYLNVLSVSYAQIDTVGQLKLYSFVKNILTFNNITPQEKVYLHFDNSAYFIGETIWFKAYVVNADSLLPTKISKVLYVELLNDAGVTCETKKLKIENGQCNGEFHLKNDYYSGFYQIRAYTRYMLNFGSENLFFTFKNESLMHLMALNDANYCMFSRVFPVFNIPDSLGNYSYKQMNKKPRHTALSFPEMETKKNKNPVNLSFFPEGGNLVNGIETVVAFEAKENSTGKPIDISGNIVNQKGEIAVELKTLHNGRGLFRLCPKQNETYTARFFYDGKIQDVALPASLPSGYVMHVENTDATVKVEVTKSIELPPEKMGISIMCRGKITVCYTLTVENQTVSIDISKNELETGVNQITLFNAEGGIYSERLFFVEQPTNKYNFSIKSDNYFLEPYQLVNLEFKLTDTANNPMESCFSLSVSDYASREESYYADNICTNLLLSSDLKGFIENASSYFTDTTAENRQSLDLLMLVQGWRRYEWKKMAGIEKFELKYSPEPALTIDGYLLNWKRHPDGKDISNLKAYKPINNASVKLNLYADSLQFSAFYDADKNGWFSFVLDNDIYGTHPMTLTVRDLKKNQIVDDGIPVLQRWFSPDIEQYCYYETHFPFENYLTAELKTFNDTVLDNAIKGKELKEVLVKGKRINRSVINYDFPDIVMNIQEYTDWAIDVFALPQGYILDLANPVAFRHRISGLLKFFREENGKIYPQPFPPPLEQIQTIKFFTNKLVREKFTDSSKSVPDLVMGFYLYPDNAKHPVRQGGGIRTTTFYGYNQSAEFYSPDYSNSVLPDTADVRRTLYWNPNVKTDKNGKAEVSFYNSSTCKSICISAEGITKDGIPVAYEKE